MKKLISLLMSIFMVSTLVACSGTKTIETINVTSFPSYIRVTQDGNYLCDENGDVVSFEVSDEDLKKYTIDETITYHTNDDVDKMITLIHLVPNEGYEFKEGFTTNNENVQSLFLSDSENLLNIPINNEEDLENAKKYCEDAKMGDVILAVIIKKYKSDYKLVHSDNYYTNDATLAEYLISSEEITELESSYISNVTVYDRDGNTLYTSKCEVDKNDLGNTAKNIVTCEELPQNNMTEEFEYNENGKIIKDTTTYYDGSTTTYVYEYEDDTHYTRKYYSGEISDENLKTTWQYEVTLDEYGNIIKEVSIAINDPDVKYELVNEYDANHYKVKTIVSKDGVVIRTRTIKYDNDYNLIETSEVYDYDGQYASSRHVYSFEKTK